MGELKIPISHEQLMSFLLYLGALMCVFLIYCTTLFSPSCISPWVSNFKYSDIISYLGPLASIPIIELKNPISQEQPMSFVIYLGVVVCAFLTHCITLFVPSYISPQVSNFNFSSCIPYLALLQNFVFSFMYLALGIKI